MKPLFEKFSFHMGMALKEWGVKTCHGLEYFFLLYLGHSGDFGNAAKMVGKMSKSVMQLISIGF